MKHRTFFWFILPSLFFMVLFIALPIASVVIQSLFVQHELVMVEVDNCGPFKCETVIQADPDATADLRKSAPLGKFNAFKNSKDQIIVLLSKNQKKFAQKIAFYKDKVSDMELKKIF